jgi:tol-pal system protein YbgF
MKAGRFYPLEWARRIVAGLVVGAFVLSLAQTPLALAQDAELAPLLDRLERLERDIKTLNHQLLAVGSGGGEGGGDLSLSAVARQEDRFASLEEDLRSATGVVETMVIRLNEAMERLEKLSRDVDFRISRLEGGASPGVPGAIQPAAALPPVPGSVGQQPFTQGDGVLGTLKRSDLKGENSAPNAQPGTQEAKGLKSILPGGTTKEQYDHAFKLLRQTSYEEAEKALKEFVSLHGDDPLASNASYWLGETHYVRGDYVQAADAFLEGYKAYPKGNKAADSLLKLGKSLSSLDKKEDACAALEKLKNDFPDLKSGTKSKMDREWQRNACQ